MDTTELLGSEDELVTLLLLELFVLVLFETALEDVTLCGIEWKKITVNQNHELCSNIGKS